MNFTKINSNYTKHCLPLQEIKIMRFFFLKIHQWTQWSGCINCYITELN